jgi:tetratricopeptide (TPR) repeat protein
VNEIEGLLESGRAQEAWPIIGKALEKLPPGAGAEKALSDAVSLAVQYLAGEQAEAWIDAYEERAARLEPAPPERQEVLRVLRLAVLLGAKAREEADALEARICWEPVDHLPWAVNVRLVYLVYKGRIEEARWVAKRSRARYAEPGDLGNRLRIFLAHYFQTGDLRRCRALARGALRHLRKDPWILGRLREIEVHGSLGRVHYLRGEYDEAEREYARALQRARRYHHTLYYWLYAVEQAWIHAHRGRHAQAQKLLDSLPPRSLRTPADHFTQVRLLQGQAELAIELEDAERAKLCLAAAELLLREHPHARNQGFVLMSRGKAEALGRSPEARRRALDCFRRAEECFSKLGAQGLQGLSATLVSRGELHLELGEIPEALDCCMRSALITRRDGFFPVRWKFLLLKSCLLLERGLPVAGRFYEEILRELGAVHSPVILFQVIANLYMYTWELDDRLDLTAHHLRQLHELRSVLDPEAYKRLYERHVTLRVAQRCLRGFFGIDPELLAGG